MKKILSILNSTILTSATESWLSFGSVFMKFYPKCIFLGALGLLFLYLRYLIRKLLLPKQTSQGIRKVRQRGDFPGPLFCVGSGSFSVHVATGRVWLSERST